MKPTAIDAYLAEYNGMKRLANLPRPRVPFTPEQVSGAFCLWRTNGDGSHVDNVRVDPGSHVSITRTLREAKASSSRARGGSLLIRAVADGIGTHDLDLLDRLATSPKTSGYLMGRSLQSVLDDPQPLLRDGRDYHVALPNGGLAYLEARRLVAGIFGSGAAKYDPEADFYSAPKLVTYGALLEQGKVISAASIQIVDGIATVWSVCTAEGERGRGAASVVVHACLLEAHRQGARAATLGTSRELARDGGLYSRLGFDVVGHEHGWMLRDFDAIRLPG